MDISERILLIIKEKYLSKRSFSKAIGCTDTAINNILNKRNDPGYKILFGILQTYDNISAEWLLTGKGKMLKETSSLLSDDQQHLFDICEVLKMKNEKLLSVIEEKDLMIKNLIKTNLILAEAKNGGVVHQGNDAECADVG